MDKEFKFVTRKMNYPKVVEATRHGDIYLRLIDDAYGNCQLSTYGYWQCISFYSTKEIIEIMAVLWSQCGKALFMLDIKVNYLPQIKNIFEGDIIYEMPYTSSNGNSMVTLMVRCTKLRSWYNENLKTIPKFELAIN